MHFFYLQGHLTFKLSPDSCGGSEPLTFQHLSQGEDGCSLELGCWSYSTPLSLFAPLEALLLPLALSKGCWELNGQTQERCLEWDWHPVNSQSMLVISIKTLIRFLMVCFLFIDLYQIGQEERINCLLGAHIG